jgi:hypothetical protein
MQRWRENLSEIGRVVAFDYPYMSEGRRRPDRMPKLIEAHREALRAARDGHTGPVFLMGKSMGSRVGCHLALEESVDGIVCFGFPLVGMYKTKNLRDQVLISLETRILLLQGTRDKMCPLDLLDEVRAKMQAPSEVHVVQAGDHGLAVTKTQLKQDGETQDDVDRRILGVVGRFVAG